MALSAKSTLSESMSIGCCVVGLLSSGFGKVACK